MRNPWDDVEGDPARGCAWAFLLVVPIWLVLGLGLWWLR
jgi:hypothetical protein